MALAALTLLALIGACGGDSATESELTGSPAGSPTGSAAASSPTPVGETPSPPPRTPLPSLGPTFLPGCGAIGLTSELDLGTGQFAQGEPISITMTLKNCGDNVVHLYYPNGERYDFFAQNESGVEVWRWSDGKAFEQSLGEVQMAIGEDVVYKETWEQRDSKGKQAPAGRYKIFAFSVGCADRASTNCTFGPVGFVDIKP
jgi:hypothetical protein